MTFLRPATVLLLALYSAGCFSPSTRMGTGDPAAESAYVLWYELRVPDTAETLHLDPLTSIDVVSDRSRAGTRLKLMTRREEAGSVIFSDSTLIFDGERRRAVIVTFNDGRPSQVFRLPVPANPKPTDWTTWRMPDHVEATVGELDARSTFMHDLPSTGRSTELPRDCFRLRYRITNWPDPAG